MPVTLCTAAPRRSSAQGHFWPGALAEHEPVDRAPYPLATNYERKFRLPAREFGLEVGFNAAALPQRIEQHSRLEGQPEGVPEAVLDSSHSVHSIALSFGPGCDGFRWEWE
ncbi:hypothetical protein V6K52_03225 [Knoellia sp. S7-12]|uniref:hypothetical protein n=1 Tax=Knoellia sp. S7-12 TaxID=3126698 RepID=UPI003366B0A5